MRAAYLPLEVSLSGSHVEDFVFEDTRVLFVEHGRGLICICSIQGYGNAFFCYTLEPHDFQAQSMARYIDHVQRQQCVHAISSLAMQEAANLEDSATMLSSRLPVQMGDNDYVLDCGCRRDRSIILLISAALCTSTLPYELTRII